MNQQDSTAARRVAARIASALRAGIAPVGAAAALALLLAGVSPGALAAGADGVARGGAAVLDPSPAARRLDGRPMSLDEAVDAAQRRYNARVVRAEVEDRGGRRVYVLRLLSSDGRVFNVRVDAASGSMQ